LKIIIQEAEKSAKRQISDDAVIAQPPVFMEQLKEVGIVAEGQNVLLEARIEPKNDSNLRVEWELNGKPVKPGMVNKLTKKYTVISLNPALVERSSYNFDTSKF
jgi:titin